MVRPIVIVRAVGESGTPADGDRAVPDLLGLFLMHRLTVTSGRTALLARFNGPSWTTSLSPLLSNTLVSIGSAASSPSHVWLFGTNFNAGNKPLTLSHS